MRKSIAVLSVIAAPAAVLVHTGSIGMEHLGLKRPEYTPTACSFIEIQHH